MSKNPRESATKTTVLLVEDNPDLRTATKDLLEGLGYRVLVANDQNHAVQLTGTESPDLALLGAFPAEGSGLATVDALRSVAPGLPALVTSGFGDDQDLRRRVVAGDVGFLSIPFSPRGLDEKINETLEQTPPGAGSTQAAQQDAAESSPRNRNRLGFYAAAAIAVLAVGLTFQLATRAPSLPEPEALGVRRGNAIELLAPIGALDRAPKRLTWRKDPDSTRYHVVLSTVDDTTIWDTQTREVTIDLPNEVLAQLHPSVSYFWQVEGRAENNSLTGRSTLVAFRFGTSEPVSKEI